MEFEDQLIKYMPRQLNWQSATLVMLMLQVQVLFGAPNLKITKDGNNMYNTIDALKNRIQLLQNRDPVTNMRIINKLKRRIRALEN